jgi:hypothetical protein
MDSRLTTRQRYIIAISSTYLVTSIHHAYGAWLYQTPWRNHIVLEGGAWLGISLLLLCAAKRWKNNWTTFTGIIFSLFFFFGAIGIYEGFYNHLLKNILFFLDLNPWIFEQMYPPPKYNHPDDWLFEITGILSFLAGAAAGILALPLIITPALRSTS